MSEYYAVYRETDLGRMVFVKADGRETPFLNKAWRFYSKPDAESHARCLTIENDKLYSVADFEE